MKKKKEISHRGSNTVLINNINGTYYLRIPARLAIKNNINVEQKTTYKTDILADGRILYTPVFEKI